MKREAQPALSVEGQQALEQRLWKLCQPYAHTTAPQHTLCERVEQFLPELFVFVAVPGVPGPADLPICFGSTLNNIESETRSTGRR